MFIFESYCDEKACMLIQHYVHGGFLSVYNNIIANLKNI